MPGLAMFWSVALLQSALVLVKKIPSSHGPKGCQGGVDYQYCPITHGLKTV